MMSSNVPPENSTVLNKTLSNKENTFQLSNQKCSKTLPKDSLQIDFSELPQCLTPLVNFEDDQDDALLMKAKHKMNYRSVEKYQIELTPCCQTPQL